ncbi:hypothetical protein GYMLUDRAFT_252828 [Collybiopsis luxurians FD-317 M1]|uniref:Uncharacterized protein n=1 Tax=Collybiopsis luxurians FD-317 M1 TaxID=944289 RepID=A0A0D0C797_9AGAR|nr:hypothetical protein GYMLUDRAFT_252828 [Collybiopsis luxurians FD-317 M1]
MSQLGLLDKTRGKILMGSRIDEEVLKVEPTVVLGKEGDLLLESETFGLILTIVDLEEAGFVRKACDWVSERSQQIIHSPISGLQQHVRSSGSNVTHNLGANFPGTSHVTAHMSSPEQNIPASATHYSGDYFSGASNFTIHGNVNINGAAKPKENAVPTAPAGFTAGMTDLGSIK